eukprot:scaffold18670_cov78-Skeletonema_dohrnii-CCMP3373.AAC.1
MRAASWANDCYNRTDYSGNASGPADTVPAGGVFAATASSCDAFTSYDLLLRAQCECILHRKVDATGTACDVSGLGGCPLCITEVPDISARFLGMYASVRVAFLEALAYLNASKPATRNCLTRQQWKRKATSQSRSNGLMKKGNAIARTF